jgi:hypothetical protein
MVIFLLIIITIFTVLHYFHVFFYIDKDNYLAVSYTVKRELFDSSFTKITYSKRIIRINRKYDSPF